MTTHIDLTGASGAVYRFTLAEGAKPVSPVAGVYAYVRRSKKEAPVVVHLGQANVLAAEAATRWGEAVQDHNATHLYTRLNVARATREAELGDLYAALDPVMKMA